MPVCAGLRLTSARADVEMDVGQAEGDGAEAVRVRGVTMDAIAPWRDSLDAIVAFAEIEAGPFQRLARLGQPLQQGRAVRQHQAGDAAQDLDPAGRQMELALPDIDPHIVGAGIDEGIASQPEPGHVEQRGQALPGDGGVDVAETDDVAGILDRALIAPSFPLPLPRFLPLSTP